MATTDLVSIAMAVTDSVTIEEGYAALFLFLDAYWERGGRQSDDLAILLGGMATAPDGQPIDLAMWDDWLEALRRAREQRLTP